jgi:hypothetical protein
MFAKVMQEEATGIWLVKFPIQRRSWAWRCRLMNLPAHTNSRALNRACVTIWKKAKLGIFRPNLVIIMPSWLRVDRAIIFFMSHSVMALIPAMIIVVTATRSRIVLNAVIECRNG